MIDSNVLEAIAEPLGSIDKHLPDFLIGIAKKEDWGMGKVRDFLCLVHKFEDFSASFDYVQKRYAQRVEGEEPVLQSLNMMLGNMDSYVNIKKHYEETAPVFREV